jgi:hypothetical protein
MIATISEKDFFTATKTLCPYCGSTVYWEVETIGEAYGKPLRKFADSYCNNCRNSLRVKLLGEDKYEIQELPDTTRR